MEQEFFRSGYCRCIDGSRTVEIIVENGEVTETDCAYPDCIYSANCPIAKEIDALVNR